MKSECPNFVRTPYDDNHKPLGTQKENNMVHGRQGANQGKQNLQHQNTYIKTTYRALPEFANTTRR